MTEVDEMSFEALEGEAALLTGYSTGNVRVDLGGFNNVTIDDVWFSENTGREYPITAFFTRGREVVFNLSLTRPTARRLEVEMSRQFDDFLAE